MVLRCMNTIDTIIAKNANKVELVSTQGCCLQNHSRGHEAPRFCIFLRKHEWHEVDLTESTFAEYTVVTQSIVFLVIAPGTG